MFQRSSEIWKDHHRHRHRREVKIMVSWHDFRQLTSRGVKSAVPRHTRHDDYPRVRLRPGPDTALDFIPHEDRISPPDAAAFSLVMLCSTPSGDAYTFGELDRMFRNAGFARNRLHALPPSPHQAIISNK